jgi:hypothetical protein
MRFFLRLSILLILLPSLSFSQFTSQEIGKYKAQAKNITIIRDKWGIPHIYGKTDADAVFGLLYAQCEENFPRVERNYLEMMGRLSEVEGKGSLYDDLEMQLIYDTAAAIKDYKNSPEWFKKLLNAFADGVNYYLVTHPAVKPSVLKKFYPWFPLIYTDGSIGPTQTGGLTLKIFVDYINSAIQVSLLITNRKNYHMTWIHWDQTALPLLLHARNPRTRCCILIRMLLFILEARCNW